MRFFEGSGGRLHSLSRLISKPLWDDENIKFFEDGDSDIDVIDDASYSVDDRRIKTDDIIEVIRTLRSRNTDHSLDWVSDYVSNTTDMSINMNQDGEIHGVAPNSGDVVLREFLFIPPFEFDVLNKIAPLTGINKIRLRISLLNDSKELARRMMFMRSVGSTDMDNNIGLKCFGVVDAQLEVHWMEMYNPSPLISLLPVLDQRIFSKCLTIDAGASTQVNFENITLCRILRFIMI